MDAQPSLPLATGLVALVQGLAVHAAETPTAVDLSPAVLAANDFRALRYGLEARIVDVDGRMRPIREVAADAIARAQSSLIGRSKDDPMDALKTICLASRSTDDSAGFMPGTAWRLCWRTWSAEPSETRSRRLELHGPVVGDGDIQPSPAITRTCRAPRPCDGAERSPVHRRPCAGLCPVQSAGRVYTETSTRATWATRIPARAAATVSSWAAASRSMPLSAAIQPTAVSMMARSRIR